MYEYQISVRILPRVTLKILMESAMNLFAKYLASYDGSGVHMWTMYNSLKTFSEAARSWSTNKLFREDFANNRGTQGFHPDEGFPDAGRLPSLTDR